MPKGKYTSREIYSRFINSPKSDEILKTLRFWKDKVVSDSRSVEARERIKAEGKITLKDLYNKIYELDHGIPEYNNFKSFFKRFDKQQVAKVDFLLAQVGEALQKQEGEVGDNILKRLLDLTYNKLFAAGNAVMTQELSEIQKKMEAGLPLNTAQKERVMRWMFQGAGTYQKQRAIDISAKVDAREERVIDNLLNAFQYGKASKADIIDGEFVEIKKVTEPNDDEELSRTI